MTRSNNLPNVAERTFPVVSAVSNRFAPERALSLLRVNQETWAWEDGATRKNSAPRSVIRLKLILANRKARAWSRKRRAESLFLSDILTSACLAGNSIGQI